MSTTTTATIADAVLESPRPIEPVQPTPVQQAEERPTAAPAQQPPTARPTAVPAEQPLLPVLGGDLQVPLATGGTVRYANLDYAATAPALESVAAHVNQVLPLSGSVHRGAGLPSQAASARYEAARRTVGRAVNARDDDYVIFTRNTTDSTNLLASAIPADLGDVVALDIEHHANLLPWQRSAAGLRVVPHGDTIAETLDRLDHELAAKPAALVAVTGASNVTGELLPVAEVAAIAKRRGARVFVDAAQLAPHRAVDLQALGADYVAFSGHKLYAPYGGGALIGRSDWLDAATPYLAGGGSVREVCVEFTEWHTGPARHEAGTPNLAGAVAIAAALEALASTDDLAEHGAVEGDAHGAAAGATRGAALDAHEAALRQHVLDGIADLPAVRTLRIWEDSTDAIGVVTFVVDGYKPGEVGAFLSAEHGVGVRDGRFCAHPLLASFGVPGALRASFGVGSRLEDADGLVAALRQLVTDGPSLAYTQTGPNSWTPTDDPRDLSDWLI